MDIDVRLYDEQRPYKGKTYTYWYLRWSGSDGRRRKKCLGRTDRISRRQAEKLRQQKQNELEVQPGRRDVTRSPELGPFLEGYFAARKAELRPGTMELHQQTGRYLVGFFGRARRLDSITRADARAFKTALAAGDLDHVNKRKRKKPPQATTVDRFIREARAIFGLAVTDDLIAGNPFDKLAGGKYVEKEWHYVGADDFARLMAACRPTCKLMLGLARWAGLRAEEALELPWRMVDLERGRVAVVARKDWQPKDGDARTVPAGPALHELLREVRELDPAGEMVIPRWAIARSNVWRDFGPLCKRAGVSRYPEPMHALRKSCITDWAAVHPAHLVQAWAGHSDYRTTTRYYLKVSEGDFERATGLAQKVAQKPDPAPADRRKSRAGEGIRTPDVQLGNLTDLRALGNPGNGRSSTYATGCAGVASRHSSVTRAFSLHENRRKRVTNGSVSPCPAVFL
jgi:integrase